MNDEEIIEAKSKEIRRLHQVCRDKDEAIKKAIDFIKEYGGDLLADELKEYLG